MQGVPEFCVHETSKYEIRNNFIIQWLNIEELAEGPGVARECLYGDWSLIHLVVKTWIKNNNATSWASFPPLSLHPVPPHLKYHATSLHSPARAFLSVKKPGCPKDNKL